MNGPSELTMLDGVPCITIPLAEYNATRAVVEAARSANIWLQENADWPKETALDLSLSRLDAAPRSET